MRLLYIRSFLQVQRQAQKDISTGALTEEAVNAYMAQHMQKVCYYLEFYILGLSLNSFLNLPLSRCFRCKAPSQQAGSLRLKSQNSTL